MAATYRRHLEAEFIEAEFRYFTGEVRSTVDEFVEKYRSREDLTEDLLNAIWERHQAEFSPSPKRTLIPAEEVLGGSLTPAGVARLTALMAASLDRFREVEELTDDAFEAVYKAYDQKRDEAHRAKTVARKTNNDRWAPFSMPSSDLKDPKHWRSLAT